MSKKQARGVPTGNEPDAAAKALAAALESPTDSRHAARLAWALGGIPGKGPATVTRLLGSKDENHRIVGLRMARMTDADPMSTLEKLAADPSAAVRREVAVGLLPHLWRELRLPGACAELRDGDFAAVTG
jgi:hypothetical protein